MMKTNELSRQVRDYIVKKLKASFGIKEISYRALFNGKSAQPQTNQDREISGNSPEVANIHR